MQQRKGKSVGKKKRVIVADFIIMGIFVFIALLLLNSAAWVEAAWEDVDFSTIMFQMHTPLNGTNVEVLYSYYDNCVPKTIRGTLVIWLIYGVLKYPFQRLTFSFSIHFFNLRTKLTIGKHRRVWSLLAKLYFPIVLTWFGVLCYLAARDIGVFTYIHNVTTTTTIFEEQYIDPNEIAIEFPEEKRNLILIYMESMESTYSSVEEGGGKPVNYIPNLTELAKNNVNFSNGDQLGGAIVSPGCGFTMGGILGTSSGVPFKSLINENSMSNYAQFLPGLTALGDILEEEGYKNYFLCGSDSVFGGRKLFYEEHGNYTFQDHAYAVDMGYIPKDYYEFWGYEDAKLYEIAKTELEKLGRSGELFNYTMLTVDTHNTEGYVCELCEEQYGQQYANVISCADRQIAEFVSWIKDQSWAQNTTVVLIGDHTSMVTDFWDDIGNYSRRTYNCFLNLPDGLNVERTKNREFDTLDYFPTILASLGAKIEGERVGLGTNLFSERQTLTEELGGSYAQEVSKYSVYYVENFENGDKQ